MVLMVIRTIKKILHCRVGLCKNNLIVVNRHQREHYSGPLSSCITTKCHNTAITLGGGVKTSAIRNSYAKNYTNTQRMSYDVDNISICSKMAVMRGNRYFSEALSDALLYFRTVCG